MLLSVIIPVYNTKDYLEHCVRSVLSCDCGDCEILLVDDGSTDSVTPQLCDRLAAEAPGLLRVIHQENQGVGGARNTALEQAKGEYLLFLDSDDTLTPDALSVLKAAANRTKADVIAFNFYSDDGAGRLTPMTANTIQRDEPFCAAEFPAFLLTTPTVWRGIWKRELFMRTGLRFPSRVWYEDLRITVKLLALAHSIVTIPDRLYLYLQHPGSIMRSDNLERNREIMVAMDDITTWFQQQGLWDTYRDILCELCIEHVYLAASVRVLRADPQHPLLREFSDYIKKNFPDYAKNPYLGSLPFLRRLAFFLLERKQYRLLRLLFRLQGRIKNEPF